MNDTFCQFEPPVVLNCINIYLHRSLYEPPKRDEEREAERKARARRARESRRSTQVMKYGTDMVIKYDIGKEIYMISENMKWIFLSDSRSFKEAATGEGALQKWSNKSNHMSLTSRVISARPIKWTFTPLKKLR